MVGCKACVVAQCTNKSSASPNKLFVSVPANSERRKMWLRLARSDPKSISATSIYMCEDHFDIEKDMENYMQYKIMGSVKKIRMKPDCIPSRFSWDCEAKDSSKDDNASSLAKKAKPSHVVAPRRKRRKASPIFINIAPVPVQELEAECDAAVVKSELPSFCRGCFSSERQLSAAGGAWLQLFRSLLDGEVAQPVYLCWECLAQLRRVQELRDRAATVQRFLAGYQGGLDVPLPAPLSRLATVRVEEATVVLGKAEATVVLGKAEAEAEAKSDPELPLVLKEEPGDLAELLFKVKEERKDSYDETNVEELVRQLEEIDPRELEPEDPVAAKQVSNPAAEARQKRTRNKERRNQKYLLCYKKNSVDKFGLEKFYTEVPINDADLKELLELDRKDALFLKCLYRCEECVRGWKQESSLLEHNQKRHSEARRPFQCDICSVRLSSKLVLREHIARHYKVRECVECGYRTATPGHSKRHVVRHHQKTVQCRACDVLFQNTIDFYRHYRSLHRHYECDHCGQTRYTRGAIERHIAGHSYARICRLCDEHFPSLKAYAKHRTLRHNQPPPKGRDRAYCVECDKHFSSRASYIAHVDSTKAHEGSGRPRRGQGLGRRSACPDCGRVYSTKTHMMQHYQCVHQGVVNKCEQCGTFYKSYASYLHHMKKHRPDYKPPPRNKVCNVCGHGFVTKWHLDNHMRTHTGERPFACSMCDARFGADVALKAHVKYTHLKQPRKQYGPRNANKKRSNTAGENSRTNNTA